MQEIKTIKLSKGQAKTLTDILDETDYSNRVTSERLAKAVQFTGKTSTRRVNEFINSLVVDYGYPVISDRGKGGYWLAQSEGEIKRYAKTLQNQAKATTERVDAYNKMKM